jgi:uncharacterized membrane protein
MENNRVYFYLMIGLLALGFFQMYNFYPRLPDQVASHFTISGQPDGWSEKSHFVYFSLGMYAFLTVLFSIIALFIPRLPDSLINLPHKDYWLDPQRRNQTMDSMSRFMFITGNLTLLLMLILNQNIINYNLQETDKPFTGMVYFLTAYLLAIAVITVRLIGKYFKKPKENNGLLS